MELGAEAASMITRSVAEERMAFIAHVRLKFDEWLAAGKTAGRDPLHGEPNPDPTVDRLAAELMGLGQETRAYLEDAGQPAGVQIFRGEESPLFSGPSLDLQGNFTATIIGYLDKTLEFYKAIVAAPQRSPAESSCMNDKQKRLDEKDAQRLKLLDAIYELTDGDTRCFTSYSEANERAGLGEGEAAAATHYLAQAGLLERTAGAVGLTPLGVSEREAAIRDQGVRTEHFSAAAVQNVFNIHAPVGVLQAGHQSVAVDVTQRVGVAEDALLGLLKDLLAEAQSLPAPDRDEAVAAVQAIEKHASPDRWNPERLKKYIELYVSVANVVSPTLHKLIEHFGPQFAALMAALGGA